MQELHTLFSKRPSAERDIFDVWNRLERSLRFRQDGGPKKSRQEYLSGAKTSILEGNNTRWVRPALDLTTHTLFNKDRTNITQRSKKKYMFQRTDYEHWSQLCKVLSKKYGILAEEVKLLLVTGSFAEIECVATGEADDLIGPYRGVQDIEEWVRSRTAIEPRGFDIVALQDFERRYNKTRGTPIHELVQAGLTNVIDLHSKKNICDQYRRIFVDRCSVPVKAIPKIPIFALSYKHEDKDIRMSSRSFLEICKTLEAQGFQQVHLWIDAVLQNSTDPWARKGLLPYTILPIIIHNSELYHSKRERIWLKLERVAASGKSGVLYTRPTEDARTSSCDHLNGDTRYFVAACILSRDYDPHSVTYESDEIQLTAWAWEHVTGSTFRSFLQISKMGKGNFSEDMRHESVFSAIQKYEELMPHLNERSSVLPYPSIPGSARAMQGSKVLSRNEQLMMHLFIYKGFVYRVRVGRGSGISVSKLNIVKKEDGRTQVKGVSKSSAEERGSVMHALSNELIRLGDKSHPRTGIVRFSEWSAWSGVDTLHGKT